MTKTAFLFPGQGAQHVGMAKTIVEKIPAAAALFEQAADILGFDLAKLCFEGPKEELDATNISQPALFVSSLAALELVKAEQPELLQNVAMTAGLSLGEYTSLVFAGAMSFEDGLKVVKRRGEAMQAAAEATPSGMASILLLEPEKVQAICDEASAVGQLSIANYLCPGNLVVSGNKAAVTKAVELADPAGGRAIELAVAGAFHTDIMKPADEQVGEVLASVEVSAPKIPVVSNVDAKTHDDPVEIKDLLVRQVLNPVRWEDSIRLMLESGVEEFYEIGPGKVLKGLMKRIARKVPCTTINDS
ncbi:MAG: ACP S-malonyltransferase [Planctomycetaceae bacterium]